MAWIWPDVVSGLGWDFGVSVACGMGTGGVDRSGRPRV